MNILIADDEFYARKALIQIIQDWSSSLSVFEAQNGKEAQAMLEKKPIDLVFTDIRMPMLDGLQLSALIFADYPQVTNVIVSGFDDFKYAQEAIIYNVKKYLLKPVEKNEVYTILEQERKKLISRSNLQICEKIRFILHKEPDSADSHRIELPQAHSYATIVLQTMENAGFPLLTDIVSEVLSGHAFVYYHLEEKRTPNMSIVLIVAPDQLTAEKFWLKTGLFHQIAKKYSEKTGDTLTVGISRIHQQYAALAESFREAKSALLYRLIRSQCVFDSEALSLIGRSQPSMADDLLHPLYQKVLNNQMPESAAIIESVFRRIVELKLSVRTLNDISYKVISIMNSAIESFQEPEDRMSYLEPIDLLHFHTMEQLIGYFHNVLSEIGRRVGVAAPKTDKIDELKAYIEEHYQETIKLEEIAKRLYYADTSYLSKQFKRRYGTSFSQYLISVRLRHAKEMVTECGDTLSIAEIARAVGFNDYSYFIQMYKKHYGDTPGNHKKGHHE